MGKRIFVGDKRKTTFDDVKKTKVYDGKRKARLGTEKKPALVNVQTEQRLKEVVSIFEEKGWKYIIGLHPDKPEDISDLEILLNPLKPMIARRQGWTQ